MSHKLTKQLLSNKMTGPKAGVILLIRLPSPCSPKPSSRMQPKAWSRNWTPSTWELLNRNPNRKYINNSRPNNNLSNSLRPRLKTILKAIATSWSSNTKCRCSICSSRCSRCKCSPKTHKWCFLANKWLFRCNKCNRWSPWCSSNRSSSNLSQLHNQ